MRFSISFLIMAMILMGPSANSASRPLRALRAATAAATLLMPHFGHTAESIKPAAAPQSESASKTPEPVPYHLSDRDNSCAETAEAQKLAEAFKALYAFNEYTYAEIMGGTFKTRDTWGNEIEIHQVGGDERYAETNLLALKLGMRKYQEQRKLRMPAIRKAIASSALSAGLPTQAIVLKRLEALDAKFDEIAAEFPLTDDLSAGDLLNRINTYRQIILRERQWASRAVDEIEYGSEVRPVFIPPAPPKPQPIIHVAAPAPITAAGPRLHRGTVKDESGIERYLDTGEPVSANPPAVSPAPAHRGTYVDDNNVERYFDHTPVVKP
jgi:hypothetical protein